jgi:hypothetical protein
MGIVNSFVLWAPGVDADKSRNALYRRLHNTNPQQQRAAGGGVFARQWEIKSPGASRLHN